MSNPEDLKIIDDMIAERRLLLQTIEEKNKIIKQKEEVIAHLVHMIYSPKTLNLLDEGIKSAKELPLVDLGDFSKFTVVSDLPPERSAIDVLINPPKFNEVKVNKDESPITSEWEAHEAARNKIKNMSPQDRRQTLIDAGIYTNDGELTDKYK